MTILKIQPDDVFCIEVVVEKTPLKNVRRKLIRQFRVVATAEDRIELEPTTAKKTHYSNLHDENPDQDFLMVYGRLVTNVLMIDAHGERPRVSDTLGGEPVC
jgi:hypothetical protein